MEPDDPPSLHVPQSADLEEPMLLLLSSKTVMKIKVHPTWKILTMNRTIFQIRDQF